MGRGDNGVVGNSRVPGAAGRPSPSEQARAARSTYDSINGYREQFEGYVEYDGISSLNTAQGRLERLVGRQIGALELRFLASLNAIFHVYQFFEAFYSLWEEGVAAMAAGRTNQHILASSHAYPTWLFSHLRLQKPELPEGLVRTYQVNDRANANSGTPLEERRRDWNESVRSVMSGLEREFRAIRPQDVRHQLVSRAPGTSINWLYQASMEQLRDTLKLHICSEFRHDPAVAQLAFLNHSLADLSSIPREAINGTNRNNPYRPRERR